MEIITRGRQPLRMVYFLSSEQTYDKEIERTAIELHKSGYERILSVFVFVSPTSCR